MKTKAVLFTDVDRVEVAEVDIPAPQAGEVLIETLYTVVSPGTELRCLAGCQPGDVGWPNIPGYSTVGRVIAGHGVEEGTLVFCTGTARADVALQWGGHVGHAVVATDQLYPVPTGLDPATSALAHIAAIAARGARLTHPTFCDTVAVLGLGPIGQLSARFFAAANARVLAVDVSAERVAAAQNAGIRAVKADGNPADVIRQFFPNGADIVVDATGVPAAIASAIQAARDKPWDDSPMPGAQIIVQGSYPDCLPVPYQDAFLKELSFIFPRDARPTDIRLVLEVMADNRVKAGDLISRVFSPDDAPKAYQALQNREPNLITVAFRWTDA